MRNNILFLAVLFCIYSCSEISARKTGDEEKSGESAIEKGLQPNLRVGKTEMREMRRLRGRDTAAIKISARDLMAMMAASPAATDSFIFYLVKYDSQKDKDRYMYKVPDANWNLIKGKSSVLVGYIKGGPTAGMLHNPRFWQEGVALFDLGRLCPPPQNCGCEILP